MTKKNTTKWLGAYLYYNVPWEEFLIEAVQPYIQTALSTGIAQQYFFIRYWDRGPHIRLRFKGEANSIDNILRANLKEHFTSYFESRPSQRKEPTYPEDLPEEHKWLPNNSLYFVDYQPEYERYGGHHAMPIAEMHFQHSSDVVLHNLTYRAQQWSYDEAMGTAIKLHLCFVHCMGMDLNRVHDFFHFLFYSWLPASVRAYQQEQSPKAYQQRVAATLEAFARAYESQRKVITPFQMALWEALEANATFEDEGLNKWIEGLNELKKDLSGLNDKGLIVLPQSPQSKANPSLVDMDNEYWDLYANYVHMTNNRLGILNRDEGYVAYLIMEGAKQLIQQLRAKT